MLVTPGDWGTDMGDSVLPASPPPPPWLLCSENLRAEKKPGLEPDCTWSRRGGGGGGAGGAEGLGYLV